VVVVVVVLGGLLSEEVAGFHDLAVGGVSLLVLVRELLLCCAALGLGLRCQWWQNTGSWSPESQTALSFHREL
jgi:hypothetical protein